MKLLSAAVAFTLLAGCGGGDDCGQDVGPPRPITATQSPYELSSLMSDLSIGSVRWLNATTGESGVGSAAQVQECVPFLGCATWNELVVVVPLIAGANTVHRYYTADGCEWRDDYLITLD